MTTVIPIPLLKLVLNVARMSLTSAFMDNVSSVR
jgi:hypothetical protein